MTQYLHVPTKRLSLRFDLSNSANNKHILDSFQIFLETRRMDFFFSVLIIVHIYKLHVDLFIQFNNAL